MHATLEGQHALIYRVLANQDALRREQDALSQRLASLGRSMQIP